MERNGWSWEVGLGRRIGKEVGIRSWVRSWTPREIERKRRVVNICEGLMRVRLRFRNSLRLIIEYGCG